jgi:hydrogenase expression/formation protein HypD
VLVPPAIKVLLSSPDHKIDGFLAAGHVCAVMGYSEYEPITQKHHIPIVVTGFEPADILQGIYQCVRQLEAGQATVENQYARAVQRSGNQLAQQLMQEVFTVVSRTWRGIGAIDQSGLGLSDHYAEFDARLRFQGSELAIAPQPTDCISGLILQGIKKPRECPAFGTRCTPEHPLGAPMVSSEGACAAYYRYHHQFA